MRSRFEHPQSHTILDDAGTLGVPWRTPHFERAPVAAPIPPVSELPPPASSLCLCLFSLSLSLSLSHAVTNILTI